ncbi:hypothetical protein ACFU6I_45545 [Streptomyces sp. NPDC057486]|uniref:hypothetical protein n=1 Tax=Streptomyces sp. NPDC057486 TaxID=3346145 RepID=UPI00368DB4C7
MTVLPCGHGGAAREGEEQLLVTFAAEAMSGQYIRRAVATMAVAVWAGLVQALPAMATLLAGAA